MTETVESVALFGYTGFVGTWLMKRNQKYDALYNSSNFKQAAGKTFDTIYFSGLPATKWMINKDPLPDWRNIEEIMRVLDSVEVTKKFVLISTIDVYEEHVASGFDESHNITLSSIPNYGNNRRRFEHYIRGRYSSKCRIVRLPGLFGHGLKKNVIYDFLNDNCIDKVMPFVPLQWFSMRWLDDLMTNIDDLPQTVNIVSPPVLNSELGEVCCKCDDCVDNLDHTSRDRSCLFFKMGKGVGYDVNSIWGYYRTKHEVLSELQTYVEEFRDRLKIIQNRRFKIGVSVIAASSALSRDPEIGWNHFSVLCKHYKVDYCEIAPTVIYGRNIWEDITCSALPFNDPDLPFLTMQSITYGLDPVEYNLFTVPNKLLSHVASVIEYAGRIGVKTIVFGCPKNRYVPSTEEAVEKKAVSFFQSVGDIASRYDVVVCIENNSKQYGCNFLTTPEEVASFVRIVNHTNIRMMIDVGNAVMENSLNQRDFIRNGDILHHVHVSTPGMKPLISKFDGSMGCVSDWLRRSNYTKTVTLEMLPENPAEFALSLELLTGNLK